MHDGRLKKHLSVSVGQSGVRLREVAIGKDDCMPSDLHLGALGQVSLDIGDVARAERFYGEILGLPHVFTFGDLAFFDMAGTRLYLHRKSADEWGPGSILYFRVDDIDTTQAELTERGVDFTGVPELIYTDDATGDQEWMTFFSDGEGNTLALMSRISAQQ